jgi:ABC-type cobalamin transport system permease subunit
MGEKATGTWALADESNVTNRQPNTGKLHSPRSVEKLILGMDSTQYLDLCDRIRAAEFRIAGIVLIVAGATWLGGAVFFVGMVQPYITRRIFRSFEEKL